MSRSVLFALGIAMISAFAIASVATAGRLPVASHGGRPLDTTLSGAAEVGGGDPDGSGLAKLTLNHGQREVCFELSVSAIATPTAAHIHSAAAGVNGPIVVNFDVPTNGLDGCVQVDRATIKAILKNPQLYYVNVHNAVFAGGAIRGQLAR